MIFLHHPSPIRNAACLSLSSWLATGVKYATLPSRALPQSPPVLLSSVVCPLCRRLLGIKNFLFMRYYCLAILVLKRFSFDYNAGFQCEDCAVSLLRFSSSRYRDRPLTRHLRGEPFTQFVSTPPRGIGMKFTAITPISRVALLLDFFSTSSFGLPLSDPLLKPIRRVDSLSPVILPEVSLTSPSARLPGPCNYVRLCDHPLAPFLSLLLST